MQIMLLRHGRAMESSESGYDRDRLLSESGKDQIQFIVQTMIQQDLVPEAVLASPYQRTQQTAKIVCDAFGLELRSEPSLRIGADPEQTLILVRSAGVQDRVVLVGHQPQLCVVAGLLMHVNELEAVILRTGELAIFDAADLSFEEPARLVSHWRLGDAS